jgi:hypothetical protein
MTTFLEKPCYIVVTNTKFKREGRKLGARAYSEFPGVRDHSMLLQYLLCTVLHTL